MVGWFFFDDRTVEVAPILAVKPFDQNFSPPVNVQRTLPAIPCSAPYAILSFALSSLPEYVILANCWMVGEDAFAKYWASFWALAFAVLHAPPTDPYAVAALLVAAFQAIFQFPKSIFGAVL